MKISSRISAGYFLLLLLLAALAAFQAAALRDMQQVLERSTTSGLHTAQTALEIMRLADPMEREIRAYTATAAAEQKERLQEYRDLAAAQIEELKADPAMGKLKPEVDRMEAIWKELGKAIEEETAAAAPRRDAQPLADSFERFRTQAYSIYQISAVGLTEEGKRATESARRAEYVGWFAAAAAVIIGILCAILVIRSISVPLNALRQGTRAMVEGKALYRLDTSRDDELAQIAKDFNDLTDRLRPSDR